MTPTTTPTAPDVTADRREGERRKRRILDALALHRAAVVRMGQRALLLALLEGKPTVTADDVRRRVVKPDGIDPRLFGSVPGPLATLRIIEPAGFEKSSRRERHAAYVQRWRLVDVEAARHWLLNNPDQPTATSGEQSNEERSPVAADERSITTIQASRE